MRKKKRSEAQKFGARGGKKAAQRMTAEQRSARAHAAAMSRHHPFSEELWIAKDGKRVGVLDVATIALTSDNATLQSLYRQACDPGVRSLGKMDTPQPADGTIVEQMNFTKLAAGNLGAAYEFARELTVHGYTFDLVRVIMPRAGGPSARFIATECHLTPLDEPKPVEIIRSKLIMRKSKQK